MSNNLCDVTSFINTKLVHVSITIKKLQVSCAWTRLAKMLIAAAIQILETVYLLAPPKKNKKQKRDKFK